MKDGNQSPEVDKTPVQVESPISPILARIVGKKINDIEKEIGQLMLEEQSLPGHEDKTSIQTLISVKERQISILGSLTENKRVMAIPAGNKIEPGKLAKTIIGGIPFLLLFEWKEPTPQTLKELELEKHGIQIIGIATEKGKAFKGAKPGEQVYHQYTHFVDKVYNYQEAIAKIEEKISKVSTIHQPLGSRA